MNATTRKATGGGQSGAGRHATAIALQAPGDDPLTRLTISPAYNTFLAGIFIPRTAQQRLASGRRVVLLIAAMAIMGIVDLMLTLTYMRSTGMYEMNPIARAVAQMGAGEHLVVFKLITMFVSGMALFLGRHSRRGEAAAWICAALLVVLMFHWANYAREATLMTNELFLLAEYGDDVENSSWVKLAAQ